MREREMEMEVVCHPCNIALRGAVRLRARAADAHTHNQTHGHAHTQIVDRQCISCGVVRGRGRTALFPRTPLSSLSCYSFLLHSHLTLLSLSLRRFSGKVEVWIIEDFKLQPVSPAKYVMLSYLPVQHGSCMNMTHSLTDSLTHSLIVHVHCDNRSV
jgi:hypothetical protein